MRISGCGRRFAVQVASGGVACVRCGGLIAPGEGWDLGHVDGGDGYAGPEHRACNRATAGRGAEIDTDEDDESAGFLGAAVRPGRDAAPLESRVV